MHRLLSLLGCALLCTTTAPLGADDFGVSTEISTQTSKFQPFTGRVTSNRVRLRLQPSWDGQILRDYRKGDLLVVKEVADEEFYAVQAPTGTKAYVFRTFVLDDRIEGSHVNVRMAPDLASPVIAQLNTGDRIKGRVCEAHPKWLEIDAPASTRFYIAKDYIENIGGPELAARHEKRACEVQALLSDALAICEEQLDQDFEEIAFNAVEQALKHVINHYSEFTDAVEKAQVTLASAKERFLKKKIDYLEARAEMANTTWDTLSDELGSGLEGYHLRLDELEAEIARELSDETEVDQTTLVTTQAPAVRAAPKLATDPSIMHSPWADQENRLFAHWLNEREEGDLRDFYADEALTSALMDGILERYDRPVKNKPGDYVILDPHTHRTLAFVYSTTVDLHSHVGEHVKVRVAERPNHNFAFPAYIALALE
ncbi:MAG: SH3 domain-containing protein [Chlamydiia bacterium]|nr:SH3 domain-containing protein [Chlamydiia bacterium]